jgi:hypothetical protein
MHQFLYRFVMMVMFVTFLAVDLLKPGTTVTLNIVEESLSLEEHKLYQTRKADEKIESECY